MDLNSLFNTVDYTEQYDVSDTETNKIWGGLSYLGFGILFFLPLCVNNNSGFGKFHANQSLNLLITFIITSILSKFISWIPFVGGIAGKLIYLIVVVLMIIGIVNGVTGKAKTLPVIGNLFTFIK